MLRVAAAVLNTRDMPDDLVPKAVLPRALRLLDAFGPADTELSLAELAERSGLPKPTALRMLGELVSWGALDRVDSGYQLGMKLFRLGQQVSRTRTLCDTGRPYLTDLYEATHENVHLAISDDLSTLFVDKVSGRSSVRIISRVGGRLPAYCTATGKVFLANSGRERFVRTVECGLTRYTPRTIVLPGLLRRELDRTGERGYGVNYEEAEVGVSAVAAPVYGPDGAVVAAISITGRASAVTAERLAPAVLTAARGFSRVLAGG
ncbi:IclR family transcriptional regulator [Amycolatopsis cihanbeyliensis]|uniref:IclR family transcriptional regulator n=2 Tax=Amycolatopsis cihanbeyliensis TaxID=1128664 RepID=A0A542CSG0_AMYCI|nr:IclR family transcriptional regulator [Amycolatopsis cihanbeyliensis]